MSATLTLWAGELRRSVIQMKRYYFETLSMLFVFFVFFTLIFFGAKAISGGAPRIGGGLEGIIVGYFVWTMAMVGYGAVSENLVEEATTGTLEQIAMSPLGLSRVVFGYLLARIVAEGVVLSFLLIVMMAVTGKWLNLDVISILPLILLTTFGIGGVGFVMGGLAIVFKRTRSILNILQIVLLAFVVVPLDRYPLMKYLPLAWGNNLLQRVMVEGRSIFQIPAGHLAFLVANTAGYVIAGLFIFRYFEKVARLKGLLGHY